MRNPKTPAEWQDAVDAAEFLLALESARIYGLVSGGPVGNLERCEDILAAGRARGVTPAAVHLLAAEATN